MNVKPTRKIFITGDSDSDDNFFAREEANLNNSDAMSETAKGQPCIVQNSKEKITTIFCTGSVSPFSLVDPVEPVEPVESKSSVSAAASVINPSSDDAKMADESSSFAAQTSEGILRTYLNYTYQGSLEKEDLQNAEFELRDKLKQIALLISNEDASSALGQSITAVERKAWAIIIKDQDLSSEVTLFLLSRYAEKRMSLWEQEPGAPCQWSISFGPQSADVLWWTRKTVSGCWTCSSESAAHMENMEKAASKARNLSDSCDRGLASAKPGVASSTDNNSARSAHLINSSTQLGDIIQGVTSDDTFEHTVSRKTGRKGNSIMGKMYDLVKSHCLTENTKLSSSSYKWFNTETEVNQGVSVVTSSFVFSVSADAWLTEGSAWKFRPRRTGIKAGGKTTRRDSLREYFIKRARKTLSNAEISAELYDVQENVLFCARVADICPGNSKCDENLLQKIRDAKFAPVKVVYVCMYVCMYVGC